MAEEIQRRTAEQVFRVLGELNGEAFEIATQTGQQFGPTVYGVELAAIRREQDRAAELIGASEQIIDDNPIMSFRPWLAAIYCDVDRPAEARQLLDPHVANGLDDLPWDSGWLGAAMSAADTIAELDWVEGAQVLLPLLRPLTNRWYSVPGMSAHGPVARPAGRLAAILGLTDEAEELFVAAEAMCQSLDTPLFLAHTHLDWGRALATSPQPTDQDRARRHLHDALELATAKGLALVERKARQSLADLDSR